MSKVHNEEKDRLAYRQRNRIENEYWVLLDGYRVGCLVDEGESQYFTHGYWGQDGSPVEVTGDVRTNIMRLLEG